MNDRKDSHWIAGEGVRHAELDQRRTEPIRLSSRKGVMRTRIKRLRTEKRGLKGRTLHQTEAAPQQKKRGQRAVTCLEQKSGKTSGCPKRG